MISAKMVKELRERTGAGMMDCKKALTETAGDVEKAVEVLREKGLASAAKKAGRIAAEGIVETYISEDKKTACIIEINCETDFVAVNENFKDFANNLAKQVANSNIETVEELEKEKYIANESKTVKEVLTELIATIGENMSIRRFRRIKEENGIIQDYIHGDGRIGVLVDIFCEKESPVLEEIGKEVAMQVAAVNPQFLNRDAVNEETLEKEKEIYRVQAKNEGKPDKIIEKMIIGKINKYYKENCLVEQEWIKDGDLTIKKLLEQKGKEIGSEIKINGFVRFEKGEGIEKKEEDFAEEVKKQMGL